MRTFLSIGICLLVTGSCLSIPVHAFQEKAPPEKVQQHLQMVVAPALANDESVAIINSIQPLLKGSKAKMFSSTSQWFAKQGFNELEDYLVEHRERLVRSNQVHLVAEPNFAETVMFLTRRDQLSAEALQELSRESFAQEPMEIPQNQLDYIETLERAAIFESRLRDEQLGLEYCQRLFTRNKRSLEKHCQELENPAAGLTEAGRAEITQQVRDAYLDIQERMVELRYYRLEDSVEFLKTSPQVLDRVRATLAIVKDANELQRILENLDEYQFQRENLKVDGLVDSVKRLIEDGKQASDGLYDKLVTLNEGLTWWYKGRYGTGPLKQGLLKQQAHQFQALEDMPVILPLETPIAMDPYNSEEGLEPYYPRRHYYTWSLEDRPTQEGGGRSYERNTIVDQTITDTFFDRPQRVDLPCNNSYVSYGNRHSEITYDSTYYEEYQRYIPPADRDYIYRIVGTYEYGYALDSLLKVVEQSTPEEISAFDQLIAEHKEFDIYIGLSDLFDKDRATLSGQNNSQPKERLKTGLAWMIALARVELSANVAAYTDVAGPFLTMGLNEFEYEEFRQILLDDLRSHILAMENYLNRSRREMQETVWMDRDLPKQQRRIKLIYAMLEAVDRLYEGDLNEEQLNELKNYQKQAKKIARELQWEFNATVARYRYEVPGGTHTRERNHSITDAPWRGTPPNGHGKQ